MTRAIRVTESRAVGPVPGSIFWPVDSHQARRVFDPLVVGNNALDIDSSRGSTFG